MKRVMVTGASGFVGANLVRRLLRDGHEIHLLLRPSYRPWRLKEILNRVAVHIAAMEDYGATARAIHHVRPEWVFNLAAYGAYPSQVGFSEMIAANASGCAAIVDACAETEVEAFIQTGSSSEYGYKDHAAAEDEVLRPNSHYAISKATATHYCQFAAASRGLNAAILRLYSIYGPFEEPSRLIPTLIAWGKRGELPPLVSPRTGRDFVYVDDAVEAMIQVAAKARGRRGAIYNVCSGVQSNLFTVVDIVRRLMNIAAEPVWSNMQQRSWDADIWLGAPQRIHLEIGWRPTLDLESGLQQTIDWSNKNPSWLDPFKG